MKYLLLTLQAVKEGDGDPEVIDLSKSKFPVKIPVDTKEKAFSVLQSLMLRVDCDLVNDLVIYDDDSPEVKEMLEKAHREIQEIRDNICEKIVKLFM